MVKHLEHCHSWTSSYKSPDGSIKTTSYADSNQASLSLPNDADQIFKSCPYCGSTFQRDMTAHVERCPQRPSVTALQSFERSIYQPRTIRNNNTVSNRFSAIAISCPRCGDLRHLENKMRHAKQCQKVDITFQTANGTSGSIFYAGPNDRLVKGLRQAATDECSNRLDQQ
jgi:acetyl-CoA carboxylase beta subunit